MASRPRCFSKTLCSIHTARVKVLEPGQERTALGAVHADLPNELVYAQMAVPKQMVAQLKAKGIIQESPTVEAAVAQAIKKLIN